MKTKTSKINREDKNLCLRNSEYHVTLLVEKFLQSKIPEKRSALMMSSERGEQLCKNPENLQRSMARAPKFFQGAASMSDRDDQNGNYIMDKHDRCNKPGIQGHCE